MEGSAYGFSQAVRVGDTIYVSGQTAMADDGSIAGASPDPDMEIQMRTAYRHVARALETFGATLADVVDETLFVTDMQQAVAAAYRVRNDVYGGRFELASSLVGVHALGSPDLLIEIKCTARV